MSLQIESGCLGDGSQDGLRRRDDHLAETVGPMSANAKRLPAPDEQDLIGVADHGITADVPHEAAAVREGDLETG
jgi:hypothetical protein